MPKPNYAFAKRQREIAKKQKADEKRARKSAGLSGAPDEAVDPDAEGAGGEQPAADGSLAADGASEPQQP